jgi:hypothetical protein
VAAALLAIVALVVVLIALARITTTNEKSRILPPVATEAAALSTEMLETYFRITSLAGRHIDDVVADVGTWNQYDDWDWGRVVYEWKRPGLRVSVATQSGSIRKVAFLSQNDASRFGTIQEAILDQPFDIEPSRTGSGS